MPEPIAEHPPAVTPWETPAPVPAAERHDLTAVIAHAGPDASERFFTFFTDKIRNPSTRAAYYRDARRFFQWCERRAYPRADQELQRLGVHRGTRAIALGSLGQAAHRHHPDALRRGDPYLGRRDQHCPSGEGPKHVVKKCKTSVLIVTEPG